MVINQQRLVLITKTIQDSSHAIENRIRQKRGQKTQLTRTEKLISST